MNKVVVLYIDDWSCLYVNGKAEYQNHDVEIEKLEKFTPIESIETRWVESNLDDYVMEYGEFPILLTAALEIEKNGITS